MVMVGSVLESRSKVEREGREVEREVEKVVAGTWRSEALVVGRGAWRSEACWLGSCGGGGGAWRAASQADLLALSLALVAGPRCLGRRRPSSRWGRGCGGPALGGLRAQWAI